jgi:hypothetical protein
MPGRPAPRLEPGPFVGPMARLEADGHGVEPEIVPTILDIAVSRRVPIRTGVLLANAVAECVAAQRRSRAAQGLPAVPPAPPPPEEMIDLPGGLRWPEADLRTWIARYRDDPAPAGDDERRGATNRTSECSHGGGRDGGPNG